MLIKRKSMLTGIIRERELPVTEAQMAEFISGSGLVQTIFPNLSDMDREYLLTGSTEEEWKDMADEPESDLF